MDSWEVQRNLPGPRGEVEEAPSSSWTRWKAQSTGMPCQHLQQMQSSVFSFYIYGIHTVIHLLLSQFNIFVSLHHRPGDDWKKSLKLPPKDMRIKTSVCTKLLPFCNLDIEVCKFVVFLWTKCWPILHHCFDSYRMWLQLKATSLKIIA